MTPDDLAPFQILASWSLTIPTTAVALVRDERRLRGAALERAWPPQSRDAAIFCFLQVGMPQLSLLVHFARTRRSWLGFGLGLVWAVAVTALGVAVQLAIAEAVDLLGV